MFRCEIRDYPTMWFSFSDSRFKRVAMDYMDVKEITFHRDEKHFFDSKKKGRLILMTTKAEELYTSFKFEKFDTIIFGRESSGVPERIQEKLNHKLKIPMIENKRFEPFNFGFYSTWRNFETE